jgi:beta-lactamase class A
VTASLRPQLDRLRARFGGTLGLAARHLETGEQLALNADRVFPTASVIKLAVLAELYRQAEEGTLRLDRRIALTAKDAARGSGVLRDLAPGLRPTLRDLAVLMIIVSDNVATKALIEAVGGAKAVNDTTRRRLGLRSMVLHGYGAKRLGESTPRDVCRLLAALAAGELWSTSASQDMLAILSRNLYLDQFPRYLRQSRYIPSLGVSVACKTGFDQGTRTDAGVVTLPDDSRFVYAVMNLGCDDPALSSDSDGAVLNGLLGRLVVRHWWRGRARDVLLPMSLRASGPRHASKRGRR